VRFYLLSTHYRSPLDFDDQKLHVAEKGLDRIRTSLRLAQDTLASCMKSDQDGQVPEAETLIQIVKRIKNSFIEAMDDDFNTALAIAALFDLCREVNGFINESSFVPGKEGVLVLQQVIGAFDEFDAVLGMVKPLEKSGTEDQGMKEKLMEIIIDIRKEARKRKDWATADLIRDRLKEIGIKLEDTPHGVRWQKIEVNHG
jgi:cysteinyl-tRNA synthetase